MQVYICESSFVPFVRPIPKSRSDGIVPVSAVSVLSSEQKEKKKRVGLDEQRTGDIILRQDIRCGREGKTEETK